MALKVTPVVSATAPKPAQKDTKKMPTPSSSGDTASIIAAITKDKGEGVVIAGDGIAVPRRLPTGIFDFDFAIGGGFPCGRFSIVYGPESSCKTNVALRAAAQAQRLPTPNNKVAWFNVEQSFDPVWAEKMGVNTKELILVEAGYGEEAIDIVDALVRASDMALVVVDSVAGLISAKEVGQSVESNDVMSSALLIKRMCNKLMIAFGENRKRGTDPAVILINQTRFKPTMFGDPETMPGGEAQKFYSSLRVRLQAKNEIDKATQIVLFKDVHAIIKKAKIAVRSAAFDFKLCVFEHENLKVGDTDSFTLVKNHLQALALLTKVPQGWKLALAKPETFPTIGAIQDRYYTDETFRLKCQKLVIDHHKAVKFVNEANNDKVDTETGEVVQSVAEVK